MAEASTSNQRKRKRLNQDENLDENRPKVVKSTPEEAFIEKLPECVSFMFSF